MNKRKIVSMLWGLIIVLSLIATPVMAQGDGDPDRPDGWDDASHSNAADPDYAVVFPQDEVNTITISISPENWQAMMDDMTQLYGEFGVSGGLGGRPPGGEMPEGFDPGQMPEGFDPGQMPEGFDPGQMPEGFDPGQMPEGFDPPGGFGGGGGFLNSDTNPIWVPADIEFADTVWTNVGIRFKGNSSLMSTWGSGNYKLPFKLDFDEFEDDYPEIDNQRFYGFKQLSFSSNWSDSSLLREKVTADIFREAGVPSAQTAFYAVYVDYGEGPIYFGLYTAVEVVDDTVIETQFEDGSGNVYKPEGNGATFAAGSFTEASFDKETNKKEEDYSDILAVFDALHADTRLSDPATWRSDLEAVFDVDTFLRWLAVNQVVQNWDTYGSMSHNYYLYTDPSTGLVTWIPWDNNMAMMEGMGRGMGGGMMRPDGNGRPEAGGNPDGNPGGFGGFGGGLSIDLDSVTDNWPLIRYLLDDPVYHELYVQYVDATIHGAFEPAKMEATYQELHDLITPYVVGESGEQPGYTNLASPDDFETGLTDLITHVNARYVTVQDYVNNQTTAQ